MSVTRGEETHVEELMSRDLQLLCYLWASFFQNTGATWARRLILETRCKILIVGRKNRQIRFRLVNTPKRRMEPLGCWSRKQQREGRRQKDLSRMRGYEP